jgi:hypothetical protein
MANSIQCQHQISNQSRRANTKPVEVARSVFLEKTLVRLPSILYTSAGNRLKQLPRLFEHWRWHERRLLPFSQCFLKHFVSAVGRRIHLMAICREDEYIGTTFWGRVRLLLAEHKPDILWIDPSFAYIGGNASAQEVVSVFLRNGLNRLLREYDCGGVVIHHTNKPPTGTEKSKWAAGDFAYLGAGSAEWANWARAVLAFAQHFVTEISNG